MQTYGQIVQTYAQTMCKIMSENPQISLMKSMEGMQRYARLYKVCRDAHKAAPTPKDCTICA